MVLSFQFSYRSKEWHWSKVFRRLPQEGLGEAPRTEAPCSRTVVRSTGSAGEREPSNRLPGLQRNEKLVVLQKKAPRQEFRGRWRVT